VPSSVAVITPIDFDHEKWLGSSIAEIATEKAGIIKPHVPVISAPQSREAETVIRKRAAECDASLEFVSEPWTKTRIGLRGEHQKLNAAVAVTALRAARISLSDHALDEGLANIEWPARFQIWDEQIVIDGAHNPAGARTLSRTWRETFGQDRVTIILAILHDKKVAEIIDALRPIASRFLLPQIRSERAESPANLAELMRQRDVEHQQFVSAADAISAARKLPERILITGSLHFAGETLAILRGEPNALEESAQ
jgi:dihydrofolate synthase/folylpolyglutamate synthase